MIPLIQLRGLHDGKFPQLFPLVLWGLWQRNGYTTYPNHPALCPLQTVSNPRNTVEGEMSFIYVGQVVTKRVVFSGSATGTPTAQVYVDGVATGSAVNGSGSGTTWVFAVTVPSADIGDYVTIVASGTVSGVSQQVEIAEGAIVETYALDGATLIQQTPVTLSGTLSGPIVRGDVYATAESRSFIWYTDPLDDATMGWTCEFGGTDESGETWLATGTISEVTIEGEDQWKLEFELDATDTGSLLGKLKWTVCCNSPTSEQITVRRGAGNAVPAYT